MLKNNTIARLRKNIVGVIMTNVRRLSVDFEFWKTTKIKLVSINILLNNWPILVAIEPNKYTLIDKTIISDRLLYSRLSTLW